VISEAAKRRQMDDAMRHAINMEAAFVAGGLSDPLVGIAQQQQQMANQFAAFGQQQMQQSPPAHWPFQMPGGYYRGGGK